MSPTRTGAGFRPGDRVEWPDGSSLGRRVPPVSTGTLLRPDNGAFGPWWLVELDAGGQSLVRPSHLYRPGGVRRWRLAEAISSVIRRETGEAADWDVAMEIAEEVVSFEAEEARGE